MDSIWSGGVIPSGVLGLDGDGARRLAESVESKLEELDAPFHLLGGRECTVQSLIAPPATHYSVSVPNGLLMCHDEDELLDDALSYIMNDQANGNLYAIAIGNSKEGCFKARFDLDFRKWLKTEFILTPLVVFSEDLGVILVCDEQMHYGILGLSAGRAISRLEEIKGEVARVMASHVESMGVGFGECDREWAKKYLI